MKASGNMSCNATPEIIRARDASASLGNPSTVFETGYFDIEHLDKDGNVKAKFRAYNGTTRQLADGIFDSIDPNATSILGASSRAAKILLYRNSAANSEPTLSTQDTYANSILASGSGGSFHTGTFAPVDGWTGDDANGGLSWGGASHNFTKVVNSDTCTMANTAAVAFTGFGTTNVVGAAVYSENSGGTAGVLIASANFTAGIASVAIADTVNVTFTIQLTVS